MKNMVMRPFDGRWLIHLFFSCLIAGTYTALLYTTLPDSKWLSTISMFAFGFSLLSQASYVDAGEVGILLGVFGADTGVRCLSGLYFNPSILATLRGLKILLGYAIAVPTNNHEGNTSNVQINYDQGRTSYKMNHDTTSLIIMKADQVVSSFASWASNITDAGGKIKYYKIGMLGYYGCFILAFITTPGAVLGLLTASLKAVGEFLLQVITVVLSFLVQMITSAMMLLVREISSLFS